MKLDERRLPQAEETHPFVVARDPVASPPGLERGVYAIGNFDGAHRGHRTVIDTTLSVARALGSPAAVLTFEPHPADFFAKRPVIFRLTPSIAKEQALRQLGLDGLVVLTFDAALSSLTAEAFVSDVLVGRLGVAAVVVGADFHFGKARSGSPAYLAEAGRRHGFRVTIVDLVGGVDAEAISSTAIRQALEAGDVGAARKLLGRDYAVFGEVIAGQKLGRTLGFPTANIALEPLNRLAHGVYAVRGRVDGRIYAGVASYGTRPTVDDGAPLLEVYLFDFSGDLYGRIMEVDFVERIRGEQKFATLEAMVAEIDRDVAKARAILGAAVETA